MASVVERVADDLGLDERDVLFMAVLLRDVDDEPPLSDRELDEALRQILDPDHTRAAAGGGCPGCGRFPGPHLVLNGWEPCTCGGHRTRWCRDDNGGCGVTVYEPPLIAGSCTPARQGFGP